MLLVYGKVSSMNVDSIEKKLPKLLRGQRGQTVSQKGQEKYDPLHNTLYIKLPDGKTPDDINDDPLTAPSKRIAGRLSTWATSSPSLRH